MAWLSPSYPIGAFSYSSGIEWAVEAGDIADAATLRRWLEVVIGEGGGFCDAVFFVHAYRAVACNDDTALRAVAELAAAFSPSKERHLETTAQGRAFLDTRVWRGRRGRSIDCSAVWDGAVALPVAVGVASAGHGIAIAPALQAYLHAMTANVISTGMRLVPLGQTDGQRVSPRSSRLPPQPPPVRSPPRSIRSAGRPSAPISPACVTKPSTLGCSGAEPSRSSLPGLTRQSLDERKSVLMDAWVKPGHDWEDEQ